MAGFDELNPEKPAIKIPASNPKNQKAENEKRERKSGK